MPFAVVVSAFVAAAFGLMTFVFVGVDVVEFYFFYGLNYDYDGNDADDLSMVVVDDAKKSSIVVDGV